MTSPLLRLAPSPEVDARVRVVTAAALFDGHDAAINIIRRLLQAAGAEVIHLGHDRSVDEIVEAAVAGGRRRRRGVVLPGRPRGVLPLPRRPPARARRGPRAGLRRRRRHDRAGGDRGARAPTASPASSAPRTAARLGLEGMIQTHPDGVRRRPRVAPGRLRGRRRRGRPARRWRGAISWLELHAAARPAEAEAPAPAARGAARGAPPGAGRRHHRHGRRRASRASSTSSCAACGATTPARRVGLLLVDPTRRRTGGALLGDRIRMNAIRGAGVFVRSLATRPPHLALSATVADALRVLQAAGFDLIVVETAGIGQSDSEIVDLADVSVYVMTPEYGAPSQLEKIDMLDFADLVVLNKSDRRGAEDALRDVRKQWRRNRAAFRRARRRRCRCSRRSRARWDDPGIDRLYERAARAGSARSRAPRRARPAARRGRRSSVGARAGRARPLPRGDRRDGARLRAGDTEELAERARRRRSAARARVRAARRPRAGPARGVRRARARARALAALPARAPARGARGLARDARRATAPTRRSYAVRGRDDPRREPHASPSPAAAIPKVALPRGADWGALVRFLRQENLPGRFPFTAGVFPFKRETRTRRACSPAKAARSARTAASTCSAQGRRRRASRPRSTA